MIPTDRLKCERFSEQYPGTTIAKEIVEKEFQMEEEEHYCEKEIRGNRIKVDEESIDIYFESFEMMRYSISADYCPFCGKKLKGKNK